MADLRHRLVNALVAKYQAQILEAQANIDVLLETRVGVAEHPGLIETLDIEVAKLAEAEDKLGTVNANLIVPAAPKVV
tara:strand:+ start:609 stop:842 length:234 start_codon:yes stop_codon:yes gene_type:complete